MPYSYNNQWHRDPYSGDDCADFFCHFPDCDEMWGISHRSVGSGTICKSRSFCYHIISPRDKPTESNESICRKPRTNKENIVSPILEQAKDTIAELHRTAVYLLAVEVCGWDYSCCLWNRAFVFYAQPNGSAFHQHPASVSFPFRVRGKGQNNDDEHDDWSSCNQWWRWCDGDSPAASKETK